MGNRFFPIWLGCVLWGLLLASCAWAGLPEPQPLQQKLALQGQAARQGDAATALAAARDLLAKMNQQRPPEATPPDLRQKMQQLEQQQRELNEQGQGNQQEIQQKTQAAAQQAQAQGKPQTARELRQAAQAMQQAQIAQQQGQRQQAAQAAKEAQNRLQTALQGLPSQAKKPPHPGPSEAAQKLTQMQAAQDQARNQRNQAFGPPSAPPRAAVERDW